MAMPAFLRTFEGGDRRSIGRSNAVVGDVLAGPAQFGEISAGGPVV
ncbi:MAG: hypothetical protein Q8N04_13295 [Nitrospira sp.]|nr:hypothetical protein [Nitrospira sp.]